jgi:hypothetical protein
MVSPLGSRVAEVYVQLKVEAEDALAKVREITEEQVKSLKKAAEAQEDYLDKMNDARKKNLDDYLKMLKEQSDEEAEYTDKTARAAREAYNEQSYYYDLQERRSKKYVRRITEYNAEIGKAWDKMLDYMGSREANSLAASEAGNERRFAKYRGFLQGAAREHNRYADRLDRRDMTASLLENISRGLVKGKLIGYKWHKDENAIQRYARGVGIAGSAFIKVRSYSEQAANQFYTLQRVMMTVQAIIGALLGSIGALVGGLMALIGVLGTAAVASVAAGSAFLSVGAGAIAARIGLGNVGAAVTEANRAQAGYNRALSEARRELRGLKFDAEEAALSQMDAALGLERAREELARVQDLPPDSRVRREVELQYMRAELNYRQAKARNKELAGQVKEGVPGIQARGAAGGGAATQAMQQLTASQQDFARYLISIQPKMKELKEASASAFLGPLEDAIRLILQKLFPTLRSGLSRLGGAYGAAAKEIAKGFVDKENIKLLDSFFKNSVPVIKDGGKAIRATYGGLLAILKAAEPLTLRFTGWIKDSARQFETWAKTGLNTGSFEAFFKLAGDVAARLGDAFGNVFGGITNIISATFPSGPESGAGGVLLSWIDGVTSRFEAFTSSTGFEFWLKGATKNATEALSGLGKLLSVITDVAAMPQIGEFWTILAQSEDNIRKLLQDGIKAGPAFARMLNSLIDFITILSDSGALIAFFETFGLIVQTLADFLKPWKPIIDAIGKFHAVILAVSLTILSLNLGARIFFGIFEKGLNTIGLIAAGTTKFGLSVNTLGPGIKMAWTNFRILSGDAVGIVAKMKLLGAEFASVFFTASIRKRSALLIQIAEDAGLATAQVDKLRAGLAMAQRQGAVTTKQLASYGGNAAILAQAGYAPTAQTAGGRMASFGRGAAAIGGSAAGMYGMSQPGASGLTQGLGMASMAAMLVPGLPGIIASLGLGIASAISGLFDAQAEKERQKEVARSEQQKNLYIQKAEVAAMTAQNFVDASESARQEIESYIIDAGLSKKGAAAALTREQGQAAEIAEEKGLLPKDVDKLREAIIASGGPEMAKSFAKDTDKSNEILRNAVNALLESAGDTSPTGDQIASTSSAIIDALATRGMKGVRALGTGEVSFVEGEAGGSPSAVYGDTGAGQATRDAAGAAYERYMLGQSEAVRIRPLVEEQQRLISSLATAIPGPTGDPGVVNAARDMQVALQEEYGTDWHLTITNEITKLAGVIDATAKVAESYYKPEVLGAKNTNFLSLLNNDSSPAKVSIENSDFVTTNKLLDTISQNTKQAPAVPAIYLTIDEKTLRNTGWQKVGG